MVFFPKLSFSWTILLFSSLMCNLKSSTLNVAGCLLPLVLLKFATDSVGQSLILISALGNLFIIFMDLLYCFIIRLIVLLFWFLSLMNSQSLTVRSHVPYHKYMTMFLCLLMAFSILFSMRWTRTDVWALAMNHDSRGNSCWEQAFLRVKHLLPDTKIGVLYLKPVGSCGCSSMYLLSCEILQADRKQSLVMSTEFSRQVSKS